MALVKFQWRMSHEVLPVCMEAWRKHSPARLRLTMCHQKGTVCTFPETVCKERLPRADGNQHLFQEDNCQTPHLSRKKPSNKKLSSCSALTDSSPSSDAVPSMLQWKAIA